MKYYCTHQPPRRDEGRKEITMYYITKSDWEKIKAQHPDYCSKALTPP